MPRPFVTGTTNLPTREHGGRWTSPVGPSVPLAMTCSGSTMTPILFSSSEGSRRRRARRTGTGTVTTLFVWLGFVIFVVVWGSVLAPGAGYLIGKGSVSPSHSKSWLSALLGMGGFFVRPWAQELLVPVLRVRILNGLCSGMVSLVLVCSSFS